MKPHPSGIGPKRRTCYDLATVSEAFSGESRSSAAAESPSPPRT